MDIEYIINDVYRNISDLSTIDSDKIRLIFDYITSVNLSDKVDTVECLVNGLRIIRNSLHSNPILKAYVDKWLDFLSNNIENQWTPYRVLLLQIFHNLVTSQNEFSETDRQKIIELTVKILNFTHCSFKRNESEVSYLIVYTISMKFVTPGYFSDKMSVDGFIYLINETRETNNSLILLQFFLQNSCDIFSNFFNYLSSTDKTSMLDCSQHIDNINSGNLKFLSEYIYRMYYKSSGYFVKNLSDLELLMFRQILLIFCDENNIIEDFSMHELKSQIFVFIQLLKQLSEINANPEELDFYKSCFKLLKKDLILRPIYNMRCELIRAITKSIMARSDHVKDLQKFAVDEGCVEEAIMSQRIDLCNPHIEMTSALLLKTLCDGCEEAQDRIRKLDAYKTADNTLNEH